MYFREYSEIENAYNQKYLNQIRIEGKDVGTWEVTEKIHGSHSAIYTDGTQVQGAKRHGFMPEGDKHFNFKSIVGTLEQSILELYAILKNKYVNLVTVGLEGEIFGGNYPEPTVPKNNTAQKVQKGVFYHPDNQWISYDGRLYFGEEERSIYLPMNEFRDLLTQVNIPFLKPLFIGSFQECLEYPDEFISIIATEYYNLPPLPDNICEGWVSKPIIPCYLGNGDRVMLKSKNAKFAENKGQKKPAIKIEMSEETKVIYGELLCLLNDNRVESAISKLGQVTKDDFGKILGMVTKDIVHEYTKDHPGLEDSDDYHLITKALNREASGIVRQKFLEAMRG